MINDISGSLDANYGSTGFSNKLGFGKKPALILIDLCEAYYRKESPLYHPRFADALDAQLRLHKEAHDAGILVVLTRTELKKGGIDGGVYFQKSRVPLTCFEAGNPLADFPASLSISADDIILTKRYPSSFFATHLGAMLTAEGIDTLLIGGLSTSGCVRATALDTCQHGFRPMVVREACADRHERPHEQNLFDINAKYGDVVSESETVAYLRSFNRPT
jgi:maleamate amidohydrolase